MQVVLKVISGRFGDVEYAEISRVLTWLRPGQTLVVGRSRSKAEFVVANDPKMSGRHFEVACGEEDCLLRDLGSSNGTFLDDRPVTEASLSDGDFVQAGETLFQVRIMEDQPGAEGSAVGASTSAALPSVARASESIVVTPAFADLLRADRHASEVEASPVNMDDVDVASKMQVVLKIQGGPFGQAELVDVSRILHWIGPGRTLKVGRHRYEADVVIPGDEAMASLHFEIRCDGRAAAVRDLSGTHGTLLNGQAVQFVKLQQGDVITAGTTRFDVRIIGAPEPAQATVEPSIEPGVSSGAAEESVEVPAELTPSFAAQQVPAVGPPRDPMKVVLKVKSSDKRELSPADLTRLLVWIRGGQSIRVGSSQFEADLPIEGDARISPLHFELTCSDVDCRLRDLHTDTGTFVNGQRVVAASLQDADEIVAGETVFQVSITGALVSADERKEAVLVQPVSRRHVPPAIAPTPVIINTTPFTCALLMGRVGFPQHSLTLIVKGTFTLRPGRTASLADEQLFPTGDLPYPDDEQGQGSVYYESDFAFVKPQTDVLLVGTCYPAGGIPATQSDVTFQVGSMSRTLRVFGDRQWEGAGVRARPSEPRAFSQMPLRYENSFGGPDFQANPCGKGSRDASLLNAADGSLPNIEDPDALLSGPNDEPSPAAFGPLSRNWSRRQGDLGSYDDHWLKTRWPWFPENFQWTYSNAADPRQRLDEYLRGDEEILLRNLHAEHAEYKTRLPGLRVRCFLDEREKEVPPVEGAFREVAMLADTLWVDADGEQAALVWRGVVQVPSAGCPQLRSVFIAAEPVDGASATLEACRQAFLRVLAERDAETRLEPRGAAATSDEEEEDLPSDAAAADVTDAAVDKIADKMADTAARDSEAQWRAILIDAGIDPDHLPAYTEDDLRKAEAQLRELGYDLPDEEPSEEQEIDDEPSGWTRARVLLHLQARRSLSGADLSGLDLSNVDFSGVDLSGCRLVGATLVSAVFHAANLQGALLGQADLSGAQLLEAQLAEADFAAARCDNADFSGASANQATFFGCSMREAKFHAMEAGDANFSEANLSRAEFFDANLWRADFSKCEMDEASFRNANLAEATLSGARGARVNMCSSNLTKLRAGDGCVFHQGMFHRSVGPDSSWTGGDFEGADFSAVDMEGADFTGASLQSANLHAANLKSARLGYANLTDALLTHMNLFQGSLESANLTAANLSGSNMYGVEFVNAILDRTRMRDTNLKMTKLKAGLFQ